MVGVKKFTAIAAVSAMVVTGAMANIQHQDASHHMLAHRGLAERNSQKQPTLIKVQKRLGPSIGDGLGGMINGLGRAIGLDGGGQGSSSSASNSPAPATTQPASNNNSGSSSNAPAPAPAASSSSPANRPAASQAPANNNNNQNHPASSSAVNSHNEAHSSAVHHNNNGGSHSSAAPQVQAQVATSSPAAPTSINSTVASASASASAAAASLLSAASASQASAEAKASAAAASLAGTPLSAASATATGALRANTASSGSSDGNTKVVVPIAVIAGSVALIAVIWTIIRRVRKDKREQYDPRLRPVDHEYHHRSMLGPPLASAGAAFAVGGAAAGLTRDRPRRESFESYHNNRPVSSMSYEEGEVHGNQPPMQEVGSTYGHAPVPSSRLRKYGSARGGGAIDDIPPAHRVTDSMYVDDYAGDDGRAVTPFTDEHGAYDVNYYDGSSTVGYNNKATRGMDAAGVSSGAGRPYSPYADLHRGEGRDEDYYDYDRASSSRRDPFGDSKRWSG